VETGVLRALGKSSPKAKATLDSNVKRALNALNDSVTSYACTLGIVNIGGEEYYISEKHIRTLMDDTLLCRVLAKESPIQSEQPASSSRKKSLRTSVELVAGVEHGGHDHKTVRREVTGTLQLGVPLSDEPIKSPVITISRDKEPIAIRSQLQVESFYVFDANFEFICYDRNEKRKYTGKLNVNGEIQRQLDKCYTDFQTAQKVSKNPIPFTTSSLGEFSISVSRNSIAKQIVLIAKTLQTYHDRGVIHGDINPSNTLILPDGSVPFDSFNIKIGAIAFAGTPGWAAPDQILRKPVTPATDIYPLGLMLVQLVQGSIFGEEKTFIIPTNLDKTHRIKVVCDAEVFLDETKLEGITVEGKAAWKKFIEKCINFDPKKRPETAEIFAAELSAVIQTHPLPGDVTVTNLIGTLEPVNVGEGKIVWSRVLYDSKNSLSGFRYDD